MPISIFFFTRNISFKVIVELYGNSETICFGLFSNSKTIRKIQKVIVEI